MKDYSISHISKDAPFTETLENTDENLNMLINKGYKQSPNSKKSSLDSVLRYNPKRMVIGTHQKNQLMTAIVSLVNNQLKQFIDIK